MNSPFSTMSVGGHEIPLKAPTLLLWSKLEEELWKLVTLFDNTFSSMTLDFSENPSSIFCLKPLSQCLVPDSKDETPFKVLLLWAGESWQEVLISHFSASSHLEGKLFLGRFLPTMLEEEEELKLKSGLPGVEGASSFLICVTESLLSLLFSALVFETGKDLTNSEVSFRFSLQSGSMKSSTKGLFLLLMLML